ncbi:MAG: phosphatidylserine decarboxylase [Elusimicrobia bacterium]|nr:phosphatidylserine decarboxylase [Elusimicrobiota bacterium]
MSEPFPHDFVWDESDLPAGSGWSVRGVIESLEKDVVPAGFREFFDRDPERASPADPALVLAPADGLVELRRPPGRTPEFLVHLRLTDVHVQRVPLAGRVVSVERAGRGIFNPDDPHFLDGVQAVTTIESALGVYRVRQITALLTKRLETYLEPGRRVAAGERLGRIRLGSAVILELPGEWEPLVADRQKVFGGLTPIARVRG